MNDRAPVTASDLIRHPWEDTLDPALINSITPESAGWDTLTMQARHLEQEQVWAAYTGEHEMGIVILGGQLSFETNRGVWKSLGRRPDVFSGMPYAVYLPRRTDFRIRALSESAEIAAAWCAVTEDRPIQVVTPDKVSIEIRGGGNATRQINSIFPPGFNCQRLVAVEVYTPSGNWSSYPPHKHDVHQVAPDGSLLEADLDEIYFYKFQHPSGFAYQRVYSADGRIDALMRPQNNDLVLVPEGYHPVSGAHGYTTYYLNFLAGSAQSLANSDDPAYQWVKANWGEPDPRLPIVSHAMENR